MKVLMVTTRIAPHADGRYRYRNRFHSPAPSSIAASSISRGTARNAARMMRTLMAATKPGSQTPATWSTRPRSRMLRNSETMIDSKGNIMDAISSTQTSLRPFQLGLESM